MWFHASTQNSWKVVTSCILFLKSSSRKQCFHVSRQGICTGRSKWWGKGNAEQPVEKVCKTARLAQGDPDRLGWALPRWEAGGSGQSSSFYHIKMLCNDCKCDFNGSMSLSMCRYYHWYKIPGSGVCLLAHPSAEWPPPRIKGFMSVQVHHGKAVWLLPGGRVWVHLSLWSFHPRTRKCQVKVVPTLNISCCGKEIPY